MKDIGLSLRTAYYNRLQGAITYAGSVVNVYDSSSVPSNADKPYILLSTYISTELGEGSKQSYAQEVTLLIDVVTKFPNSMGGKKQCDTISNSVIELIRTRQAGYLTLSGFQIITTLLDSNQTLEELVSDGVVVRRLIRFRHKIFEV